MSLSGITISANLTELSSLIFASPNEIKITIIENNTNVIRAANPKPATYLFASKAATYAL